MCDIVDRDDGYNLASKWQRARKPHQCYACDEAIAKGALYHFEQNAVDGTILTYKHCERCWVLLLAIARNNGEGARYDLNCGEIWELAPPEIAALAFWLPSDGTPAVSA